MHFLATYEKCVHNDFKDPRFKTAINQRYLEFSRLSQLYLNVIHYERAPSVKQEGNLLAQLISYYELMLLL